MSEVIIRNIKQTDNKELAGIIRSVLAEFGANHAGTVYYDPTTDDLFSLFAKDKSAYFTAEINGEIVGGGGIYPTPALPDGYCELVKLYLLPVSRGTGLGKKLILKCFEAARNFGYTHMYLETMPELKMALGMYLQLGFTHLDGALGKSGHFGCAIWMVKELK